MFEQKNNFEFEDLFKGVRDLVETLKQQLSCHSFALSTFLQMSNCQTVDRDETLCDEKRSGLTKNCDRCDGCDGCNNCDARSGTARDADTEIASIDEFQFEEPMVFDLVRGLGSKPGEMEANYLMIVPLNDEPVLISPEFEFVYSTHQVTFSNCNEVLVG